MAESEVQNKRKMAPRKVFNMSLDEVKILAASDGSGVECAKDHDVVLQIHPMFASDIRKGVNQELTAMSSRYSRTLGGIPLAYEKVRISSTGGIMHASPYINLRVWADFFIFSPEIGMSLEATVRKKSQHHLSCLVHNMINVSVPRPHDVPAENWDGSYVEEEGRVVISLVSIDMAFHLPMLTGQIESILSNPVAKVKVEEDVSVAEGFTFNSSLNTRLVFEDDCPPPNMRRVFGDSGISSEEDVEKVSGKERFEQMAQNIKQEVVTSEDEIVEKKKKKKKKDYIKQEVDSSEGEILEKKKKYIKQEVDSSVGETPEKRKKKKKKKEGIY